MASSWVGLTFPGMIDEPGSLAGNLSSWKPARGPEASQRMPLAIFMSETATPLNPALTATMASSESAWTNATALLIGFLFVAACAYLADVYLTGEASRRGDSKLRTYFARRAQAAAVVAGALSLSLLAELHSSNRLLYGRLTGRALPLVIVAALCGLITIALLNAHWLRLKGMRLVAALGVAAVVWGWGVAQYPVLLPRTTVTLSTAGAPQSTLDALFAVFLVAVVLLGPSFVLLYTLQSRRLPRTDDSALASTFLPNDGAGPAGPVPPP
jgi:cytochrome bd-type quinol oxidase subunit 2